MLKIGDFARLCQLPVKTLRYYDELGLITPARVDAFTGYRYYAVEQLPRLNRLLALRDLGFSLEQIARVLNDGVTHEQLRGMLMLARAEAEHRLHEDQGRMARIEARLRDIEQEDNMPEYDVALKTVQPMLVAACRIHIPKNDMVPALLRTAYSETSAHVSTHGGKDLEPCLALWHTTADTYTDEDAEAVVPINRAVPESDRVKVYELAGGTFASAVHHGDFAGFTKLHPALLRWIDANGYRITGPSREIYVRHDAARPGDSVTEVQYPVEKE
ncbi:MAG: MerR family transcriptional regulator [Dehalococcoidia bacterium]|nr:MerR family transcriptional regulator [Dehalococcoidia bacterium]